MSYVIKLSNSQMVTYNDLQALSPVVDAGLASVQSQPWASALFEPMAARFYALNSVDNRVRIFSGFGCSA
jgi:hypothetical protein